MLKLCRIFGTILQKIHTSFLSQNAIQETVLVIERPNYTVLWSVNNVIKERSEDLQIFAANQRLQSPRTCSQRADQEDSNEVVHRG